MPSSSHESELRQIANRSSLFRSAAVLLGFFLALAIAFIWTKAPSYDELYYSVPALDLITRGSFGIPVLEPTGSAMPAGSVFTGVNHHLYLPSLFHWLLSSVWYKIAGFSILTIRFYSLLWGVLFLGACYAVLYKISSRPFVALSGVTCVAFSHIFVNAATDGRPDIVCATLGISSIAAYLLLREDRILPAILASHTLLAVAAAVHPVALVYLVAVLLTTAYCDFKRLRVVYIFAAAVPYLVIFGAWFALMWMDQDTARTQFKLFFTNRAGTWTGLPTLLWNEWAQRYWGSYQTSGDSGASARFKLFPLFFYPLGLLGGAVVARNQPQYRLLLWLALSICLTLARLDVFHLPFYLIHTVPWCCMLLGVWLAWLWDKSGTPRRISAVLAILFLALNVGWTAYAIRRDPRSREFADAVRVAREHSGPADLVMGPLEMGLAFGFYNNLIDDCALGYFTGKKARVIIVDERGYGQAFNNYALRTPYLNKHVTHLLNDEYGLVLQNRLYRIYARK